MKWTRKARIRLARIVWEKGLIITNQVKASNMIEFRSRRDLMILSYFEKVGFQRTFKWESDNTPHHPQLFKPNRTHLFFLVATNHVVKVEKVMAEKILVLGLP